MEEESLIHAVCERIDSDKSKLESKEFEIIELDSFNMSDFWKQFGTAVQSLSNEVTKVSFMCGKSPFPKTAELNGMLGDLMQHYSLTRDLYLVLPEEVGATVRNGVTGALLSIMSALLAVIRSLGDLSDKGARERLPLTSALWDACNAVEFLPRDNLAATQKALEEETALATDAQEELVAVNKVVDEPQVSKRAIGGERSGWPSDDELIIPQEVARILKDKPLDTASRRNGKMTIFRPDGTPIKLRSCKIKRLLNERGQL